MNELCIFQFKNGWCEQKVKYIIQWKCKGVRDILDKIEELRYLIKAAGIEGEQQYRKRLAVCQITPTQNEILKIVAPHQFLSINQIGNQLICGSDHPSRVVQRMVDKGLLNKEEDYSDYRKTLISITEQGRGVLRKTSGVEAEFNQEIEGMIQSNEAVAKFIEVLTFQTEGTKTFDKIKKEKSHLRH